MKLNRLIILTLCFVLILAACAGPDLTPKQRYYLTRATFNDMVAQYISRAELQPESVRAELRMTVNPLLIEAEAALDLYEVAIGTADEQSRRLAYIQLINQATDLMLKYGIEIQGE